MPTVDAIIDIAEVGIAAGVSLKVMDMVTKGSKKSKAKGKGFKLKAPKGWL